MGSTGYSTLTSAAALASAAAVAYAVKQFMFPYGLKGPKSELEFLRAELEALRASTTAAQEQLTAMEQELAESKANASHAEKQMAISQAAEAAARAEAEAAAKSLESFKDSALKEDTPPKYEDHAFLKYHDYSFYPKSLDADRMSSVSAASTPKRGHLPRTVSKDFLHTSLQSALGVIKPEATNYGTVRRELAF